jgi:hypothetical protein
MTHAPLAAESGSRPVSLCIRGPTFVDVPMKTCYLDCCWFVVTVPPGRWVRLELAGTLTAPILLWFVFTVILAAGCSVSPREIAHMSAQPWSVTWSVDTSFSSAELDDIRSAMSEWNSLGSVLFEVGASKHAIDMRRESEIGRRGWIRGDWETGVTISVTRSELEFRAVILHELGHAACSRNDHVIGEMAVMANPPTADFLQPADMRYCDSGAKE